jgi:hypothetical protein
MISCPEEQRSRSFASHPQNDKGVEYRAPAQDGAFIGIEIGDSGYGNPRAALALAISITWHGSMDLNARAGFSLQCGG